MLTADQWMLVLGMTAILFLTRIAGLVIADRLPDSARVARILDILPGVTLVAIVLPSAVSSGPVGIIASIFVWLVVSRTGNLALGILLGVGLVTILG